MNSTILGMAVVGMALVGTFTKSTHAKQEKSFNCIAHIRENGVLTNYDFLFSCSSLDKDTTFTSPKGRFTVTAFADDTCTPQLIAYDKKLRSASYSAVGKSDGSGFDVFDGRLFAARLATGVSPQALLNPPQTADGVAVGCSSDPAMLDAVTM